ncbi:MAG: chromate transporter [Ezakiella sp.]|nr:chromate transporter [Ezakiella sp.]MDD7471240.1 chromate transporter [Bacillota bacterium]MDY3923377.1 chromate transporter [Ezakiella sp.]
MKNDFKKLLKIFLVFLKIGTISFGGGYGMIIVMKKELVSRGLVTEEEFMDSLIIAQTTPGALAVNLAIAQAGNIAGWIGQVVAFVGVVLPSFLCILILSTVLNKFKDNIYVKKFMDGSKPAVLALITMSFIDLLKNIEKDFVNIALMILTVILTIVLKLHPVIILLIVGTLGYFFQNRKNL